MKTIFHKADTRGLAEHGWLKSSHTFSFASYHNPERMHYGALRVLNDDQVAPGQGFGTHPHNNMEIVSIPLAGSLKHADSEGNKTVIKHGEVQIMSAGTGVSHSEHNGSDSEQVNFLQIWIIPKDMNIKPRYEQKMFEKEGRLNKIQTVVSPIGSSAEGVKINQSAYFSLLDLEKGNKVNYNNFENNQGVYLFVLEGELTVSGTKLEKRDGLGVTEHGTLEFEALANSELLIMEVPMLDLGL